LSRSALLLAALAFVAAACASDPKPGGPDALPVVLEGNEDVSTRRLEFAARRELASFEEHGRRPADLADAAYSMELELRRRGYAHSAVRFRLEPSEAAPERIVFIIEEGPLGRIGEVRFPGAAAEGFTQETLMKFFPTGDEPVFQRSQVDNAVGEIERTYLLAGYGDARVGPAAVNWNDDKTLVEIAVPIYEGPQYVIESYSVEGDLYPRIAQTYLEPLRGAGFYLRLPAEAAAQVRAALMDRGHQKAVVRVATEFEGTHARLTFTVEAGEVFHVREVTVTGRDRTREKFVRSRIPLKPGEVASQSEIAEGVDDLYRSGIFRSVDVKKSYISEREMDIDFALEELDARSVSFDVGWGSYELLRGGVRFQDRNFLGLGRRLDVQANASTVGYEVGGSIADNYLLGVDNTLRLATSIFQRREPSFTRFGYDLSLSLSHRLNDQWRFTSGYAMDTQEASDVQTSAPDFVEGEFLTSAGLFANIGYDSRDSSLIPKRGSKGELGVLWSSPLLGADLNYVGLRAKWFSFFPLSDNITLGTGFRFESRPLLDDSITLPIQKRLFLGGPTTVRSFRQSQLGPFDPLTQEPVGGLTLFSAHVELRARVWRALHVAFFYEAGMVSLRSLTIDGPFGQAIGTGLRYYLPVGPIRIDAAYNPGETFSQSSRWAFHFAFGFSF